MDVFTRAISYDTASCHPAGGCQLAIGYVIRSAETTATSRVPACVGWVPLVVIVNRESTPFAQRWRRARTGALTVIVAVLLFAVAVPLHELVTRTQYDFVAVNAGVVYDALFVPTGVVVVPLAPSNQIGRASCR